MTEKEENIEQQDQTYRDNQNMGRMFGEILPYFGILELIGGEAYRGRGGLFLTVIGATSLALGGLSRYLTGRSALKRGEETRNRVRELETQLAELKNSQGENTR